MNIQKVLCSATALMIWTASALGQSDAMRQRELDKLSGWSGIVFDCNIAEEGGEIAEDLCRSAASDAKLLSAVAKIPMEIVERGNISSLEKALDKLDSPLHLELDIIETKNFPKAVSIQMRAATYYSRAINLNAGENSPERQPRPAKLVLWERSMVARGDRDLSQGLSRNTETFMKEFFAAFVEARNLKPAANVGQSNR